MTTTDNTDPIDALKTAGDIPTTPDDDWEELVAAVKPIKRACPINPIDRANCAWCEG